MTGAAKQKPRRSAARSRALDAVEKIDNEPANEGHCITERMTPHGYWWRYRHSAGEPQKTLDAAIMVASEVAADEARKAGKTFVVASVALPAAAVYVFAYDHPDAAEACGGSGFLDSGIS
jgi:hypothetical protein